MIIKTKTKNKKCFSLIISFLILTTFFLTIIVFADETQSTLVYVNPTNSIVASNENFNITINCNPSQPIKSFELKLSFNASLITANIVSEGNIFNGFNTFFNSGIINNTAGTIVDVYGLILGQGNVSNSGTLATIYFNATSNIGTSYLNLINAGITNETTYLSILTNNGNVSVNNIYYSHILSNESPVNNSYNILIDTSFLSINVEDPEGDPFYWEITTFPFIGNNSGICNNSTITCNISNLAFKTTYAWFVKCKDLVSGQWTNNTYFFTTKSSVNKLPGNGGYIPPIFEQGENNPPSKPLTPSGSVYVEKKVIYEYSSVSFDTDDDKIRYMFDWGDGTFSNWSDFLSSNTTVYMRHSWDFISNFKIMVIAQDENGINSTWSDPLEIIVSGINGSEKVVLLKINVTSDYNLSNNTFIFDASKSIFFNTTILNYTWDFGDGQYGYGVKTVHTYNVSNDFTVILIAIDDQGNTYYENIKLNAFSGSNQNSTNNTNFDDLELGYYFIISFLIFIVILCMIKFREKIEIKLLDYKINKIKKSKK